MKRLFVHTEPFVRCWKAMGLEDDSLKLLEEELLKDPQIGDVIPGLNGARKLRFTLNDNHGKRGGSRIIYIDILQRERLYLLFAYPKSVQEDLNEEQKNTINHLIAQIKKED